MPKRRAINLDDDTVLWQSVVAGVTPLKSTVRSAEFLALFADPVTHGKIPLKRKAKIREKTSLTGTVLKPATAIKEEENATRMNPVDLRLGDRAGIDGGTQRRLFRGEVTVDRRLDLHGMSTARAKGRLTQFIETAAYERCRCVLVITGKGSGVLRGHVPDWLKRLPLSPHVLALAEARPKDGGGGALYVLLRRKRVG